MDAFFLLDTRMDRDLSERLVSKFSFCESFIVPADRGSKWWPDPHYLME